MSAVEKSGRSGPGRFVYYVCQVLVRLVFALVLYTVFVVSGALASDGVVAKTGTAIATDCERVGPVSRSGLGWYWQCDAEITWSDGSKDTSSFTSSDLTPRNRTEPAPVAWREVDNSGHMITVERAKPFAGFGWAVTMPLFGAVLMGVELPRLQSVFADQWTRRRERTRMQLWEPAMLPLGWGLLIAGGLATAAPAVLPGMAVITILLGYCALAVALGVAINRRRQGLGEPPVLSPERREKLARVAKWLRGVGAAGVVLGVVVGFGNWLGVLGAVAIPLALVAFGQRMVLVTNRHRARFDGTVRNSAAS
ncbi:DUF6346 domain-containing protein [Saccharopolyspora griseoalba]|uniref:DUF6346 domain-containing protein n=1 Tax=Saccharopolyspora griseoalba TaxID=1431848 RepID=A0ABW2LR00_9PSEU